MANGKKGVRAFGAVHGFFVDGTQQGLVDYEATLGVEFKIPFTVICAYKASDIAEGLTAEQLSSLHLSHGIHRNFGYNVLESPPINQHIALMHDTDEQRDLAIAKYINEGLKRNQLCVYGSMNMRDIAHRERISSLIDNYEKNITDGNLIIVDLAPYYIAAMSDNFGPFDAIKNELQEKVANREDKHIRLAGDCVAFLFKNKHFDECINLEGWWHQKPFRGSYLCPYPNQGADKFPYGVHRFRILANHDVIADWDGNIVSAHVLERRHSH